MAIGNFLKLYNMVGNYRTLLSSRLILPTYQPVAMLKQSSQENIGLPVKPKRPLSSYFIFMKDIRPLLMQKHPELKVSEIVKLVAEEWKKVDAEVKKKMDKEYKIRAEEYQKAKVAYDNSITDDQKKLLHLAKLNAQNLKDKKRHEKAIRNLGKPKRPATAFALYVRSVSEKRGTMKLSEYLKSMVPKWEALPEKERAVFEMEAMKAMNAYKQDLKAWQEKMLKLGNYEMVRYGKSLNPTSAAEKPHKE